MDNRKMMIGLAIVFAVYGLATMIMPETFFGTGTFYDRNFSTIRVFSIGSLVLSGICLAVGMAIKKP